MMKPKEKKNMSGEREVDGSKIESKEEQLVEEFESPQKREREREEKAG